MLPSAGKLRKLSLKLGLHSEVNPETLSSEAVGRYSAADEDESDE